MDPPTAALMPKRPHVIDLQKAGGCDVDMQTVPAGMQLEYTQPAKMEILFPHPQEFQEVGPAAPAFRNIEDLRKGECPQV
jgi:hypothetical protein